MRSPSRSRLFRLRGLACLAASGWVTASAIGAPAASSSIPPAVPPASSSTPPAVDSTSDVDMNLLASGATERLGGYRPQQLKLVKGKPAALKTAPELTAPLYGQIRFGGKNYVVAVDEPEGADAKLYVDSNGNGDLTDDPETKWEKQAAPGPDGKELTQYKGSFQLPIASADGAEPELVTLGAYRFDKNDPRRAQLKATLLYYADYAYEGEVTLAGAKFKALLADDGATGQFGGTPQPNGASRLIIDINGDGSTAPRGEAFESNKPFNVKGTTWELAFPGEGAAPFKVAKSNKNVAEIPLPPNHAVGQKITPFKAKRMDGKAVNFPDDYKGKIVLLDFWATWCPPCREELPGLVAAYNEYKPKGVEVLGISLDQAKAVDQIKGMMKEQGMTWPQVYDGKFWKAAVAEQYGIQSIPAAFLVDGDTGIILAAGGSLRGGNLTQTLETAVAKKSQPAASQAKAEEKAEEKAEPAAEPAAEPTATPEPAEEPKAEEKNAEDVPF
jgi:thiol-disulfide isomerase/thioredoxin